MESVCLGLLNCTYGISLSTQSFSSSTGGNGVSVTAPSGCTWSAANTSDFIAITAGATGNGNGVVSFTVPANLGTSRSGALVIAGHLFTVTQSGQTTTTGLAFFPLAPCRIADTRSAGGSGKTGPFGPPFLAGGATRSFPIPASFCQLPASAEAYSLNVGVLPHGPLSYLTAWPAGPALPLAATLGSADGLTVANAALVPAGTDSAINLYPSNDTDAIIDINGYFAPPNLAQALAFYTITPCRVVDTRVGSGFTGNFGEPFLSAGTTRTIPIPTSACGLPGTAQAYSLNIGVLPRGPLGYLTTWPAGSPLPVVATLGSANGNSLSNAAVVAAGTSGAINIYVSNDTDVIVDSNGYFAPPGGANALYFHPLTPCRIVDTRAVGGQRFDGSVRATHAERRLHARLSDTIQFLRRSRHGTSLLVEYRRGGAWAAGLLDYLAGRTAHAAGGGHWRLLKGASWEMRRLCRPAPTGPLACLSPTPTDLIIDIDGYFAP